MVVTLMYVLKLKMATFWHLVVIRLCATACRRWECDDEALKKLLRKHFFLFKLVTCLYESTFVFFSFLTLVLIKAFVGTVMWKQPNSPDWNETLGLPWRLLWTWTIRWNLNFPILHMISVWKSSLTNWNRTMTRVLTCLIGAFWTW